MATVRENLVVVAATVIGSVLFLAVLNRVWAREKRRAYNDLIGWQLSILGTTYAVILGFMLYTVWTSYGEADLNVDLEADAVMNVYRLAEGLPEPQRSQLQSSAISYVQAVVEQDWPQMARGEAPQQSVGINTEMWKTVISVRAASLTEQAAVDHALAELSSLNQHRLKRLLESTTRLPNVLWSVLLVGGVLTILAACTFGVESMRLHILQVFSFSLLVSLSLVAIADIHRPFQGLIHVSDDAFQRAQRIMQAR